MFETRYSRLDRLLHGLAFAGTGLQRAVADVEDQLYRRDLATVEAARPVFITSLPRAGTTLLLEVMAAAGSFATHTYRDMPFVLCPLLWSRVSQGFRKGAELRERAHGDGMAVGYDSAEAFEEVLWKAFWPEKYAADRILPWQAGDEDEEFEGFFRQHVRKMILLRARPGARYVSKNNANIARLDYLPRLFPDSVVVVPFRDPVDHVGSLLRQHRNFTKLHAEDAFARRYMESIGHLEFGAALRPIDFDGWLERSPTRDSQGSEFWFRYWIAAFEHLLARRSPTVQLFDYDACCEQAEPWLDRLAGMVGAEPAALRPAAARFRAPTRYGEPPADADPATVARARELFARLRTAAAA